MLFPFSPEDHGQIHQLADYRAIGVIPLAGELIQLTIEAFFEAVQSIHGPVFVQIAGYSLEIIQRTAGFHRPANHLPLHQVIGHHISIDIVRRAVYITGLSRIVGGNGTADGRSLVKAHIQPRMLSQGLQHPSKIALGPGAKAIPHAGSLHNTKKSVKILMPDHPNLYAALLGHPHIVAGFLGQIFKQLLLGAAI